MTITAFDDLARKLADSGLTTSVDADARVIELATRCGPVCLRWDERLPLVHIVVAIYAGVTPFSARLAEQMIARYNHQLPLPGLGVDRETGLVYFRWVLAHGPGGLELEALATLLALVVDEIEGLQPILDRAFQPVQMRPPSEALGEIVSWLAA